jgi:hypothetical protein
MRVDGWHTAIRGLGTTFYAYVKGASENYRRMFSRNDLMQFNDADSPYT